MSKLPKFNELNTCHFITTKVWQDVWLFKEERYCQIIIDNLNFYRQKFSFKLVAYAVLPWHLHLILMLSRKFNDISKVMQDFKSHTAKEIVSLLQQGRRKPSLSPYSGRAASEGSLLPTGEYNVAGKGSLLPVGYRWIDRGRVHTPSVSRIWQRNFYDFNIYSNEKLEQKVGYVNNNAAKHGLVDDPIDWKFCSARNYYLNDHSVIKIDEII